VLPWLSPKFHRSRERASAWWEQLQPTGGRLPWPNVDIDDVPRLYAQEGEGGAGPGGPQPGVSTDPCDGPSACDCVLDDIVETVGGQPCNITLPSGNTVAGWQKITDYTHYFDCSPIIGCGHVICPDATDTFTEYGLCVPNSIGRMGHELRKKLPF